jgi:DNA-binding FadR family transcriptional regulator
MLESDYKIKPINSLSLADKVELSLMEYISRDDVNPGDAMPKELELAETLGVSRTVIREATLRLRLLGLLKSRKHQGMVVMKPDVLRGFEKVLKPEIVDEETLIDVFELRIVLEIGMGELLFARKTQDDIDELQQIVEKKSANSDKGIFEIEEELQFHGKLYEMCGNQTLKRFQEILLPVFRFVNEADIFQPPQIIDDHVTHSDLVQVIRVGTPEKFQAAMKKHLQPHFDRLKLRRSSNIKIELSAE